MEQWLIDLLSNLTVVTLSGLFALFVIHRYQRNKERRELKADFLTEISENFTLLRTFKLNFSNWGKMVFVANKAYRGLQYVKNEDQRQTIKEMWATSNQDANDAHTNFSKYQLQNDLLLKKIELNRKKKHIILRRRKRKEEYDFMKEFITLLMNLRKKDSLIVEGISKMTKDVNSFTEENIKKVEKIVDGLIKIYPKLNSFIFKMKMN